MLDHEGRADMATRMVTFEYMTGLTRSMFHNARLRGSWDITGRYSDDWTERPMQEKTGPDGCPMFTASVSFDLQDQARTFRWGVVLDGPQGTNFWGIPTEVHDIHSAERYRELRINGAHAIRGRYLGRRP
jgi:1,4-alpha-glucan branching enzyme